VEGIRFWWKSLAQEMGPHSDSASWQFVYVSRFPNFSCVALYLLLVILYGGKGDELNVYYNSIEIIDLGTLAHPFLLIFVSYLVEKELIELKPEEIVKKNIEEEVDIQEWSRKSLDYLQVCLFYFGFSFATTPVLTLEVDIEELSSLLGLVVQGVLHEQGESEFLLQAMKEAQESQQLVQEKVKKYQL
jgi:hypothetical protein